MNKPHADNMYDVFTKWDHSDDWDYLVKSVSKEIAMEAIKDAFEKGFKKENIAVLNCRWVDTKIETFIEVNIGE